MKTYLVETSVIVAWLRGHSKAAELLEALEGELASSYVCLAELYEGIHRVKDRDRAESMVLDFFAGLSANYGLNEATARYFGLIRSMLKRQGQVIEDLDILIAATCFAHNLTLLTANPKHFSRIRGLPIEAVKL